MRTEQCDKCDHYNAKHLYCNRSHIAIRTIKGCSLCPSSKMFFRARSGKEGFRLNVLGKNKGDPK